MKKYTVKMVIEFLSPAGIIPARESLISDILPGDGKIGNLYYFYSVLSAVMSVRENGFW
jgi:hypothetical protein